MGEMDAYKDIFLSESAEFIQQIIEGLLALESNPHDLEPVEVVFRGAHSLKGMAAAMGYDRTSDLTHKMESLMDRVRKQELEPDGTLVDLMLEAVDMVKDLIEDESSGSDAVDPSDIASRIVAMAESQPSAPKKGSSSTEQESVGLTAFAPSARHRPGGTYMKVVVTLEDSCVLKSVRAYMVMKRLNHMGTVVDTEPTTREIEDEEFDLEFAVFLATEATEDELVSACMGVTEVASARAETTTVPASKEVAPSSAEEKERLPKTRRSIPKLSETQTVRISIGHLDNMVDLVGELVILRARLESLAARVEDRGLDEAIEDLSRVSAELQHEVMQTRMVPVGNIFNRFPRMVRDLAHDLGKDLEFKMAGLDIELDRTVLDEIGDPIVHLLRNAVDHGVETPEEREAAGKPPKGLVRLEARRERDNVLITVSDDGRGMDLEEVWRKAVDSGLARPEDRASYSDEDVLAFTCVPGFSTSKKATKVSGRGVGMDVVKGKIEHLGGALRIRSTLGEGSEFVLTLPLTLAIIQSLLVETRGQTFAIPLSAVEEIVSGSNVTVDTIDGAPVVVLRDGDVVPVFSLDVLLNMEDASHRVPEDRDDIVLMDVSGARKALLVDELKGRMEIVIKPLARMFRSVGGLGGATVLGDGTVALIIDPRTIFPGREEAL